ncbi:MAG TPA: SpoIIE family protein phosphatase [Thermoanaerobaculia bacterium]|jgi:serine phosphatase RsbU (regulator of sigma subunit)
MSPRTRIVLVSLLTLVVMGGTLVHMVARARHWHEQGWSGVGYLFGENARFQAQMMGLELYQVMITASKSPADGRLHYRDEILTLNGIPRDDVKRLTELNAQTKRGDTVVYRIRRGKEIRDVPLRFESPLRSRHVILRHLAALTVGLTFVAIALFIMIRAPHDTRATVFFALALLSAVAVMGNASTTYEQIQARGIVISAAPPVDSFVIFSAAAFMYPPLILHLALIFPRRRPIAERNPIVIRWIYSVAVMAVLSLVFTVVMMSLMNWDDPGAGEARLKQFVRPFFYGLTAVAVLFTLHVLWAARREGVKQAIVARPLRMSVAAIGLLFGLTRGAGSLLGGHAAGILGGLSIVLPLVAICTFPVLALIAYVRSYLEANVEEKRQVAWPMWSLLLVVGGKIVAVILSVALASWVALRHLDLIAWRGVFEALQLIPTLLTLAIPIAFAVAILKYRLMNIDLIIRKTVVYAILSGAIIVVYLGLVGGLGSVLVYSFGLENQTTMVIGSTLVVALLFVPLRNKLQFLVDRNLFRHKYDYPAALKAISTDARTLTDAHQFLSSTAEKLQQALQNRAVVIFAERQDEYVALAKVGVADALLGRLRVPSTFAESLDRPFDPRRRALPQETAAALARVEASLVVPVGTRAFIAAAPKLSAGEYDVEDIDFFRSVAEQIDVGLDRIRMQAEEADYEQARQIQQTLLPRDMPRVAGIDVSGIWQPARTMGGDYYDLLPLQESELAVCIGDVAGKGMPAALLMSGLQAAVRASASSSPRDLCERVRRVVVSSLSGGRFVTFFYATVDTANMRLRWCNAGHNAPILARADGTIVRLAEGGPAFSRLLKSDRYEEREIALQSGDRLVLFTDGVSEAMDGNGELFGETRIEELVSDCPDLRASELQKTIVDAASAFSGGELEDDLTLVVVRITG